MTEPGPSPGRRRGRLLLAALAAALTAGVAAALLCLEPRHLTGVLVRDDAGYYLSLARNHCLGLGWTVDGSTPTNGFHPLWAALLSAATPAPCSIEGTWRAMTVASTGVFVAQTAALAALVRRLSTPGLAAAAAIHHVLFVCLKGLHGTDAPLALLLFLLWSLVVLAPPETAGAGPGLPALPLRAGRTTFRRLASPVLLALAVLTRLDLAVFALAALALRRGSCEPRDTRADGLGFAAGLVGIGLHSAVRGDSWLPVSAWVKSGGLDPLRGASTLLGTSLNTADLGLCGLALLALPLALRSRHRGGWLVATFALAATGRVVATLLVGRFDAQIAHFVPALVVLPLLAAILGDTPRRRSIAAATLVGLGLLFAGAKAVRVQQRSERVASGQLSQAEAGRRLAADLPADAVLFGGGFGLIGLFADRPWLNADGVTSSRRMQQVLATEGIEPWLSRHGVTHVAALLAPGVQATVPVHASGTAAPLPLPDPVCRLPLADRGAGQALVVAAWPAR